MARAGVNVGTKYVTIGLEGVYGQLGLQPFLDFNFILNSKDKQENKEIPINFSVKVHIKKSDGSLPYAGPLHFEHEYDNLSDSNYFNGRLHLDYYSLSKIEEIRSNGDLMFYFMGNITWVENERYTSTQFNLEGKIAQSDWIKTFLVPFDYKHIHLVEMPVIDGFNDITKHLDSAWKSKSRGEYDDVLLDCRKALEEIGRFAKTKGFEKTIEDKKTGEKRTVPDWDKYLASCSRGDIFENIYQKILGFVAPGAHAGSSINLAEADYTLLITHAIVNYSIKRRPEPIS